MFQLLTNLYRAELSRQEAAASPWPRLFLVTAAAAILGWVLGLLLSGVPVFSWLLGLASVGLLYVVSNKVEAEDASNHARKAASASLYFQLMSIMIGLCIGGAAASVIVVPLFTLFTGGLASLAAATSRSIR